MRSRGLNYNVEELLEKTRRDGQAEELAGPTQEGGDIMSESKWRSVYRVIAVDWRTGKVVLDETVVEKDEGMARMKAMTYAKEPIDLDRVDIGCTVVIEGFIRPKKETQKVTIEKEESSDKEAVSA